jgi:hypothetical protein
VDTPRTPNVTKPQSLWADVFPVLPLEPIDGFVTETILGTICRAPDPQVTDGPGQLTKAEMIASLQSGLLGLRCGTAWPAFGPAEQQRIADAVSAYLTRYEDSAVSSGDLADLALVGAQFAIRALVPLIDPNETLLSSDGTSHQPTTDAGVPIVGSRWEYISWHDVNLGSPWPAIATNANGDPLTRNADHSWRLTIPLDNSQAAIATSSKQFWAVAFSDATSSSPTDQSNTWGYAYGKWTQSVGASTYFLDGWQFKKDFSPPSGPYTAALAPANSTVITSRKYGAGNLAPPSGSGTALPMADGAWVVGPGGEETVCLIARFIAPGLPVASSGGASVNYGPPTYISRLLYDSLTPDVPMISGVTADVWNLRIDWTASDDSVQEIRIGYRLVQAGSAVAAHDASSTLQSAFRALLSGTYDMGDPATKQLVLDWLSFKSVTPSYQGSTNTWTFLDPIQLTPYTDPASRVKSIWFYPKSGSAIPSIFQPSDGDVYFAMRDQYEFQFALRSVASAENSAYAVRSAWTVPSGPLSTLPRTALWQAPTPPSSLGNTAAGPRIDINVTHQLPFRDTPGDLTDLTAGALAYRLIVRRLVQDGVIPVHNRPDLTGGVLTQRILLNPQLSPPNTHPPTVQFVYSDCEVTAPDVVMNSGGNFYKYELQIEQVRRGDTGDYREIQRGSSQQIGPVPVNSSISVISSES